MAHRLFLHLSWVALAAGGLGQILLVRAGVAMPKAVTLKNERTDAGAIAVSVASAAVSFPAYSQAVLLRAEVFDAPGAPALSGAVVFSIWQGAIQLGAPMAASVSEGAATGLFTVPAGTAPGSYSIHAAFTPAPGSALAGSTDTTQTLRVAQAPVVKRTKALAAGDGHCPAGGVATDIGLDNGAGGGLALDGILENGEVTATAYVCDDASESVSRGGGRAL